MTAIITQAKTPQIPLNQEAILIYDTDVHGAISGLIALKALQKAGIKVIRHFSHFPGKDENIGTTPQKVADTLSIIVQPGVANVIVLDIPIDSTAPKKFIDALSQYTFGGRRVIYIDHHGHSAWSDELAKTGVEVHLAPTSYEMSMLLPKMLGVEDSELRRWALIGAVADFDASVIPIITKEFEESVTDYFDPWFKFHAKQLPPKEYVIQFGNVGAIVQYFIDKNIGPEEALMMAREQSQPVPLLQHKIVGDVVVALEIPPSGLAWKCAGKLTRETDAPIAVVIQYLPQRNQWAVVCAVDWKKKQQYGEIIDIATQEVAQGRSVVGHPGARSIACTTKEEAEMIRDQLVEKLNELIMQRKLTPRVTHLVSDQYVAQAVAQDFKTILSKIASLEEKMVQVLEEMRKMYEQYLKLKEKQVELLERTERKEYD